MDVAVPEEPQKKIFRARKTMKISDRQQLEYLHNTLSSNVPSSSTSSTSPTPALVNGKHPEEGQMEVEKDNEKMESNADSDQKKASPPSPVSRSPTPPALSLSLSPSPPAKTPEDTVSSTPPSPSCPEDSAVKENEKREEGQASTCHSVEQKENKDGEDEEERDTKEEEKASPSPKKEKEEDLPKPQESPSQASAVSPVPPATTEGREEDKGNVSEAETPAKSEEPAAMDIGPESNAAEDDTPILDKMAAATSLLQCPILPANTSSSSPSLSPSHTPECDQEVKEGFLVLSEEDESQGEKDEEKEKTDGKDERDEEKMEIDTEKESDKGESAGSTQAVALPSTSVAPPAGEAAEEEGCGSAPSTRKRTMAGETEPAGHAEGGEETKPGGPESQRKRPRVEGEELEAHLELKISGNPDTRHKLEKVVQQLVAEQLRVLQLSVFDRSLQELRERVEKIDCATKHQQTLNTLQAKIARLTKKFGAANQAKENARKPQEMLSSPPSAAANTPNATTNGTPTYRTVRSLLDSKRTEHPGQTQTQSAASSAGPSIQPKLSSTLTPSSSSTMGPAPVLSLITTSSPALPSTSFTSVAPSAPQNQALMIKANPANSSLTPSTTASPSKPVPLLIQLPLAVTNPQGGALMSNNSSGVELVPVSSLAGVNTLNKAKTTTATTAFIIQKPVPSSSSVSVPPSPSLPQITLARAAVYPGSSGLISVPSSGVSVTSARTPTQCASVAGATLSSLPTSAVPAATGGQSSGAAASAPVSSAAMASKTDNQATNHAPDSTTTKTPVQAARTSKAGAVIDLTEDDDDVLVTGVKKAPVQSGPPVPASPSSSSPSSAAPRAPVGPSSLNSHTTIHVQPAAQTTVNVLQRSQAVAPNRALSATSRPLPSSTTSSSLSAPPVHNSGSVGGVRGLVGVTAAGGSNRQGSPQATGVAVRSSPQSGQHSLNGPQLTVHHRPLQDSPSKNLPSAATTSGPAPNANPVTSGLPPLPSSPVPPRLPAEALHTSPPQQPQLKLARVQSQNGIVLSWCVEETDRTCAAVDSYHLYAYHQDHSGPASSAASQWKKIGEVKALPLPMACTLTQFVSGSKYYFAVRARDIYGRFGPFCEPQCTDVIAPSSSSSSSSSSS